MVRGVPGPLSFLFSGDAVETDELHAALLSIPGALTSYERFLVLRHRREAGHSSNNEGGSKAIERLLKLSLLLREASADVSSKAVVSAYNAIVLDDSTSYRVKIAALRLMGSYSVRWSQDASALYRKFPIKNTDYLYAYLSYLNSGSIGPDGLMHAIDVSCSVIEEYKKECDPFLVLRGYFCPIIMNRIEWEPENWARVAQYSKDCTGRSPFAPLVVFSLIRVLMVFYPYFAKEEIVRTSLTDLFRTARGSLKEWKKSDAAERAEFVWVVYKLNYYQYTLEEGEEAHNHSKDIRDLKRFIPSITKTIELLDPNDFDLFRECSLDILLISERMADYNDYTYSSVFRKTLIFVIFKLFGKMEYPNLEIFYEIYPRILHLTKDGVIYRYMCSRKKNHPDIRVVEISYHRIKLYKDRTILVVPRNRISTFIFMDRARRIKLLYTPKSTDLHVVDFVPESRDQYMQIKKLCQKNYLHFLDKKEQHYSYLETAEMEDFILEHIGDGPVSLFEALAGRIF